MGTPIIWSLYLSPLSVLIPCFIATNSAPKTEVSRVGCFLESQIISNKLQYIRKPVRERQVPLHPTRSLSTIKRMSTVLPRGSGWSGGIASVTSPYNSVQSYSGKSLSLISGLRISWVKDESRVMLLGKVTHNMKGGLKVAFTWQGEVR